MSQIILKPSVSQLVLKENVNAPNISPYNILIPSHYSEAGVAISEKVMICIDENNEDDGLEKHTPFFTFRKCEKSEDIFFVYLFGHILLRKNSFCPYFNYKMIYINWMNDNDKISKCIFEKMPPSLSHLFLINYTGDLRILTKMKSLMTLSLIGPNTQPLDSNFRKEIKSVIPYVFLPRQRKTYKGMMFINKKLKDLRTKCRIVKDQTGTNSCLCFIKGIIGKYRYDVSYKKDVELCVNRYLKIGNFI